MDHPDNLEQPEEILELQDRAEELEKRLADIEPALHNLEATGQVTARVLNSLLDLIEENRAQMRQIDKLTAVARQLMAAQHQQGQGAPGEDV